MSKKSKNVSIFQKRETNLMNWVGFWRKNPHRFADDYVGVKLHMYQKILLYLMNVNDIFMYIAARGAGKSFLLALYAVIRCILYPNTNIIIASGTKGQARLIISEKIVSLYNNSEAVRAEIGDFRNIKTGANDARVSFLNGSKIEAVTSSDSARGYRGNILILDEFRLIDKKTIQEVLTPMLNVVRTPPFTFKPEYKGYPQEENKTVYISSAWYKTHWAWDEFKDYFKNMLDGSSYFVADTPYTLSVHHGLLTQNKVNQDRKAYDKAKWEMEYEGLFVGENDKGYFKLEDINKCRTITKTFIPPTNIEFVENNSRAVPKNLSNIPRIDKNSEIRIVSLDVALMGGSKTVKNDSSAFTCMRLVQEKDTYRRDVLYLESVRESISANDLGIRAKQLYNDFEADYVVIDTNGIGTAVLEAVCSILYDEERDIEYPAWSTLNNEEENERLKTKGTPIVVAYKADAKFNNAIAIGLKTALEEKKIRFPITDIEQREYLVDKGGFLKKSIEEQQRQLHSFQQSSALANELVALEYSVRSGNIVIQEVGTTTKDRYSSLAYGNHFASELEKELRETDELDGYDDFFFISSYN